MQFMEKTVSRGTTQFWSCIGLVSSGRTASSSASLCEFVVKFLFNGLMMWKWDVGKDEQTDQGRIFKPLDACRLHLHVQVHWNRHPVLFHQKPAQLLHQLLLRLLPPGDNWSAGLHLHLSDCQSLWSPWYSPAVGHHHRTVFAAASGPHSMYVIPTTAVFLLLVQPQTSFLHSPGASSFMSCVQNLTLFLELLISKTTIQHFHNQRFRNQQRMWLRFRVRRAEMGRHRMGTDPFTSCL